MNPSAWINVNGKAYSRENLKKKSSIELAHSDFEKSTLKFCCDWLNHRQEFVIQTSGSTGSPKPITLFRDQMEASARQTIEALQLKAGETALVCLDTKYIAGQMMLVRSLLAGMNIMALEPSSNPFDKVKDLRIDFVALVPYQLDNIINQAFVKLNQVRCAIIGGAAISQSLKEKIKESKCAIYATYGMTETLSHIALQRLNGKNKQDYFKAFPSVRLRRDDRGCLCINANYLKEEVITNDLVELLVERKFRWLGRIDNMINSAGVKVIPEKVELILNPILASFQIVNRFFIIGLPDEKLGTKVAVVIEGPAFNKELQKEILFKAAKKLSKYELPKQFLFAVRFSETTTGKINRAATIASIQ